jgi:hypothetical protein
MQKNIKAMNRLDKLKKKLDEQIPGISNYLQLKLADEIWIAEDEKTKTACIIKEKSTTDLTKVFAIIHSSEIAFIPVDGKNGLCGDVSNCDFVFFNELNFCFVELKLNASSPEERAIRKNREKAVEQLKQTIHYFNSKLNGNYLSLDLEAYISTPDIYPRRNTAWQLIKMKFLEETGINLFESRKKEY